MKDAQSDYINDSSGGKRCNHVFRVDEQINLAEKSGSVRVFSTRGKKCGLQLDPDGTQGYCYWHETNPQKSQDPDLVQRLEKAIKHKVYLGDAFLSGGGPGTHYAVASGPMDLSGANLQGGFLVGAYMEGTILNGSNLREVHLQGAWLGSTNLSGADLTGAHLHGTDFQYSCLERAELWGAEISNDTRLGGVSWGDDFVLGTEIGKRFNYAEATYRILKQHRQESGDYRAAGEFYFREMECIRKQQTSFKRILWTIFYKSTCGYGERPTWTFAWAIGVILFWGLLLLPLCGIHNPEGTLTRLAWPPNFSVFLDGLSLSLITFATLGYGNRYPASSTGEILAGFEALLGILLASIFVVSFAKKVIRG
jgi:uncharacterized protein YjbI with pentapeptide repeats